MRVWGLGLGFGVWGLGFRVLGVGFTQSQSFAVLGVRVPAGAAASSAALGESPVSVLPVPLGFILFFFWRGG